MDAGTGQGIEVTFNYEIANASLCGLMFFFFSGASLPFGFATAVT